MELAQFRETLQNERGDIYPNYRVYLLDENNDRATIFSDLNETPVADNVFIASNLGKVNLYVLPGVYTVVVEDTAGNVVDSLSGEVIKLGAQGPIGPQGDPGDVDAEAVFAARTITEGARDEAVAAKDDAETAAAASQALGSAPLYSAVADFPTADGTQGFALILTGAEEGVYEDQGTWVRTGDTQGVRAKAEADRAASETAKVEGVASEATHAFSIASDTLERRRSLLAGVEVLRGQPENAVLTTLASISGTLQARALPDGEGVRILDVMMAYPDTMEVTCALYSRDLLDAEASDPGPNNADTLIDTFIVDPAEQGRKPSAVPQKVRFDFGREILPATGHDLFAILTVNEPAGEGGAAKTVTFMRGVSETGDEIYDQGWTRSTSGGAWATDIRYVPRWSTLRASDVGDELPPEFAGWRPSVRRAMRWVLYTDCGRNLPAADDPRKVPFRVPGGDTVGNAFGRFVSNDYTATTWPTGDKQIGVEVGHTTPLASLADASTHPLYSGNGTFGSVTIRQTSAGDGLVIQGLHFDYGNVSITFGSDGDVLIEDTLIDTGDGSGDLSQSYTYGIEQTVTSSTRITVRNVEIADSKTNGVFFKEGVLDRVYSHRHGGDFIRLTSFQPKDVVGCFAHGFGKLSTASHGDVNQTSGATGNTLFFGNGWVIPALDNEYDDGNGETSVYNLNNDAAGQITDKIEDVVIVGDVAVGASYTLRVGARAGQLVNGVAVFGTAFSLPAPEGGVFTSFNTVLGSTPDVNGEYGTTENLAFCGNFFGEDGTPLAYFDPLAGRARVNLEGLYNYNRDTAPPMFVAFLQLIGWLDDDKYPLVPVKSVHFLPQGPLVT